MDRRPGVSAVRVDRSANSHAEGDGGRFEMVVISVHRADEYIDRIGRFQERNLARRAGREYALTMEQTQTNSQWKVWASLGIVAAAAVGIFLATRPTTPADAKIGGPDTWDPATRQYVAEQHALAEQHFNQGRPLEAQAVLTKLVTDYPGDPVGHALLGQMHMAQDQWKPAYASLSRSLELDEEQAEIHFAAGTVAELLDKDAVAITHYKRAAELEPGDGRYPLRVANAALKAKSYDDARIYALRVLKLDDTASQGYAILAAVAAQQNQIDSAIDRYNKAIERTDPQTERAKFVSYTLWKAQLLRRKADPKGREEALNLLLALPESQTNTNLRVTSELSQTYLSLNRKLDAAEVWADWCADNPLDAKAAANAGLCYQRAGKTKNAQLWHTRAVKLAPHLPEVQALGKAINRP